MAEDTNIVPLGRERAYKTGEASCWTPREAVVEMLRLLDAGLNVDKLIICYDGIGGSNFQSSCKSAMEAIGLLQVTQLTVYEAGR